MGVLIRTLALSYPHGNFPSNFLELQRDYQTVQTVDLSAGARPLSSECWPKQKTGRRKKNQRRKPNSPSAVWQKHLIFLRPGLQRMLCLLKKLGMPLNWRRNVQRTGKSHDLLQFALSTFNLVMSSLIFYNVSIYLHRHMWYILR